MTRRGVHAGASRSWLHVCTDVEASASALVIKGVLASAKGPVARVRHPLRAGTAGSVVHGHVIFEIDAGGLSSSLIRRHFRSRLPDRCCEEGPVDSIGLLLSLAVALRPRFLHLHTMYLIGCALRAINVRDQLCIPLRASSIPTGQLVARPLGGVLRFQSFPTSVLLYVPDRLRLLYAPSAKFGTAQIDFGQATMALHTRICSACRECYCNLKPPVGYRSHWPRLEDFSPSVLVCNPDSDPIGRNERPKLQFTVDPSSEALDASITASSWEPEKFTRPHCIGNEFVDRQLATRRAPYA